MLVFEIQSQEIKLIQRPGRDLIENQLNFIVCKFIFSDEWYKLDKVIQFRQENVKKIFNINGGDDNTIYINLPSDLKAGTVVVSIYGQLEQPSGTIKKPEVGENITINDVVKKVETNAYYLQIKESGFKDDFIIENPDNEETDDKHFIYHQRVASNVWVIEHNLNKYPSVTTIDSGGTIMIGQVIYVDPNTIVVTFNIKITGTAFLN